MQKTCTKCGVEKHLVDFHKNSASKDGHRSECKVCNSDKSKAVYKQNSQPFREKSKSIYQKNKSRKTEYNKSYYSENRGDFLDYQRDYYARNKPAAAARCAKRRASKLKATPGWLTEEHKRQIHTIYEHAKDCEILTGEKYHVDHIIPLQGKDVCGLHVPWNLQVLPSDLNISKSNKI